MTENITAAAALEVFISKFNDLVSEHNDVLDENDQLRTALTNADRMATESQALNDEVLRLKTALNIAIDGSNKTTTIAAAQAIELAKLREQVKLQQADISRYKALNPERLQDQNKRLKESNADLTSKNNRLTHEKGQAESRTRALVAELKKLEDENLALGRELSHNQGTGIYHHGQHHLIVWPQQLLVEDPSGKPFRCRALLYMHSSGRGGLMTYNPENGTQLCASPVGGLKPSAPVIEFAQNWLYKVNELQKGIVEHSDMMAVDYNPSVHK